VDILKKLQNQPESARKIILWSTVTVIGVCLLFFCIKNFQQRLKSLKMEEFKAELKLYSLEREFKTLTNLELPTVSTQPR